jgi:hypothetical protein
MPGAGQDIQANLIELLFYGDIQFLQYIFEESSV